MSMFADSSEVMRALATQTPFFIRKLNHANLRARGVHSLHEYMERYESLLAEFTFGEKVRISRMCEAAMRRCRNAGLFHLFDVNWRFAKCSDALENGYPHTVGGIVVLPEHVMRYGDDRMVRLIVHEVTHVHQRAYPAFVARHVRAMGFEPARRWESHRESLRANPDTDDTIYAMDRDEANPVLHRDAESLADVSLAPCTAYKGLDHIRNPEHPFEIIAELNALAV